jgi:hypothetical protein
MNDRRFVRFYGIISITLVILLLVEAFIRNQIKETVLVTILDYCFWYVFGLFSAFFILRRIIKVKNKNDKENLLSQNYFQR